MIVNIAMLRQFSIGSIIFTFLIIGLMVLGILGCEHVFFQTTSAPTAKQLLSGTIPKYIFKDSSTGNWYSYEISIYILAVSFSMMIIVIGFWLFFSIKNLLISIEIDKEVKSDLKTLAIINFFTFFIGSILQLATCDVIIEKYKLVKSYEREEQQMYEEPMY